MDETESIRRVLVAKINSEVKSEDKQSERARLEAKYGQVWNTDELTRDFEVLGFAAPLVVVRKKATVQIGALTFQDHPRFYFSFIMYESKKVDKQ